jgi:hypothetical protein
LKVTKLQAKVAVIEAKELSQLQAGEKDHYNDVHKLQHDRRKGQSVDTHAGMSRCLLAQTQFGGIEGRKGEIGMANISEAHHGRNIPATFFVELQD